MAACETTPHVYSRYVASVSLCSWERRNPPRREANLWRLNFGAGFEVVYADMYNPFPAICAPLKMIRYERRSCVLRMALICVFSIFDLPCLVNAFVGES